MRGLAWVSVLLVTILTSCASRSRPKATFPTLNIPPECASKIELVSCDLSFTPPRCRAASVEYRKGCEQVVVLK